MTPARRGPIVVAVLTVVAVVALLAGATMWALGPAGEPPAPRVAEPAEPSETHAPAEREPADPIRPATPEPRPRAARPAMPTAVEVADFLALPAAVAQRIPPVAPAVPPVRIEALVAVEDDADPAGVAIVGPIAVERTKAGDVLIPLAGRRALRWWVRTPHEWLHGEATAARDATPASAWGDHVLVRVLDAAGRAASGVGVTVWRADSQSRSQGDAVPTDALGVALLPRPALEGRRGAPAAEPVSFSVKVVLPFVPPVAVPLPADGAGPVVVRLPPAGRVEVVVKSSDAARPEGRVVLNADVAGSQQTGFADYATELVGDDGVARFAFVGLGLRFTATLAPGEERVTTTASFDGPATAGATARVELPYGAPRPAFTGRLVRTDGAPAAKQFVQVAVARRSPASPWNESTVSGARSDEAGRFRVTLNLDAEAMTGANLSVTDGVRELLRRTCPPVVAGGTVDLGDVVLDAAPDGSAVPVLVAGVVRDEEGRPVPEVLVQAWRRRGDSAEPVIDARATTSADGTFEIRAAPTDADAWDVRIAYHAASRIATPATFEPGARGVVLVARRTGTVAVRVLLPPRLTDGSGPEIVLEGEAAEGHDEGLALPWMFGTAYRFLGLGPGAGRIVARVPGDPSRVLRAIDVAVVAGQTVDAGTLDLRGAVPVLTVRVVGDDGKTVPDGGVWWRRSGARDYAPWTSAVCATDGAVVLSALTPIDVIARRTGSGSAVARGVTSDVTLKPPPRREPVVVDVVLAEGIEIPDAPWRLMIRLQIADGGGRFSEFGDPGDPRHADLLPVALSPASRRARFQVSEPGRYVASLVVLRDRGGGASSGRPVRPDPPATLEIGDDRGPRTLTLRVTAEQVAEARRALE
jgi:hypothetical protein